METLASCSGCRSASLRSSGSGGSEAKAFLAGVADHRLSLVTGLRRGEVLGLRWADVDLAECQLLVTQQLCVEPGRPMLKQLKTKSSERAVTLGPGMAAVLETHQERQAAEATFAGDAWEGSGLVFTTALGRWIDPNNFSRTMDVLIEKVGVPRITPKGLRHTAQSVGRVVVGDDTVMQERLGHADIGITLGTYTQVVTEQHRLAVQRLGQVFSGPASWGRYCFAAKSHR